MTQLSGAAVADQDDHLNQLDHHFAPSGDPSDDDYSNVDIDQFKRLISDDEEDDDQMGEGLFLGSESESEDDEDDEEVEEDAGEEESAGEEDKFEFDFSDEDEDYDPNEDEDLMNDEFEFKNILRELSNMKPKRRKGGLALVRARSHKVSPEVRMILSNANEAFVRNDYQVALESYLEVVKLDPKNFSAYKTIGEIYQTQNQLTKCCNFWILAAHLHPWDSEFWTTVGDLSYELGHTRQAMYCYTRAVQSGKKKNLLAIFKRGILLRETEHYVKAADSFQKLLKLDPTNENILKELVVVYVNQNRIGEAVDIYLNVFKENLRFRKLHSVNPELVLSTVSFGWSELNILTELFAKQTAWDLGLSYVKPIARWIQGRESQTWWNDSTDDSEFDERRFENPKFKSLSETEQHLDHELPIDIRVQMGLFRLNTLSFEEAFKHFEFLLASDTDANADLFYDVGKALESKSKYNEALKFFSALSHVEDYNNSELIFSISKCLMNAHHYALAKGAYEVCLTFEPENLDVIGCLIEIANALGEQEYADDMMEKFFALKDKLPQEAEPLSIDDEGDAQMTDDTSLALIENRPKDQSKRRLAKLTDQEWYIKDEQLTNFVLESFNRASRLEPGMKKGDKFSVSTWMETVTLLLEIFVPARGFFYGEKSEPLKKFLAESRISEPNLNRRIARITRVREQYDLDKRTYGKAVENNGSFRGKDLSEWFDLMMQFCLALAEQGDESAFNVLQACENANCFTGEATDITLLLVGISISAQFEKSEKLSQYTRSCLLQHQFSSNAVKLFIMIHKGHLEISEENHSSHQKFFLRQIKAFDSLRLKTKISGLANIYISDVDTSHEHPLLNYVYAGLLLSTKSYMSHLAYIHKLIDDGWKNEPMLYFCLGLGHVHRAMNRLANNRNLEILQGVAYLMKYSEMKRADPECTDRDVQETHYNLGRTFHMLGLASLAVEQYKKVMELKVGFLEAEANYNMYLIQNIYGSGEGVELMTV